jgi:fluoride exporter
MLRDLLLVAGGGACGASLRYLAGRAASAMLPATFPWGTWLINVSGCLLMGVVAGLAENATISPATRLFLATGILGGYTTFSAFGLEAHGLLTSGRLVAAFGYIAGQLVVGIAAVFLGIALVRRNG